jgi:hypothetical protein
MVEGGDPVKCCKCDKELEVGKKFCHFCGTPWSVSRDENFSGFTETLGNIPMTRLLITLMAWPDWLTVAQLLDWAKVTEEELNIFLPVWADKGFVLVMNEDYPPKSSFKFDSSHPIGHQLEELNNVIINYLDMEEM